MKASYLIAIAENDDARSADRQGHAASTDFAAAKLPAEIEVYQGTKHGWCPPDSRVYDAAQADKAWSADARACSPNRSERRAAMTLTFYTNPMSRGRIVRWMLEEVGAPYETVVLDYATTMKAEPYLSINPMGKVPAIVHDGHVGHRMRGDLYAYLAEAFPEAGLGPDRGASAPTTIAGCSTPAGPAEQADHQPLDGLHADCRAGTDGGIRQFRSDGRYAGARGRRRMPISRASVLLQSMSMLDRKSHGACSSGRCRSAPRSWSISGGSSRGLRISGRARSMIR